MGKRRKACCLYHSDAVAVKKCCKCTVGLCKQCGREYRDKYYCYECYDKYVIEKGLL